MQGNLTKMAKMVKKKRSKGELTNTRISDNMADTHDSVHEFQNANLAALKFYPHQVLN